MSGYDSSSELAYLIQCTVFPRAVTRPEGDPQIQQLTTCLLGYIGRSSGERIVIADIGAGTGDLLQAIKQSGCSGKVTYVPVESDTEHWETITSRAKKLEGLEFLPPRKNISALDRADIVFFVNVLHELSLPIRIELLSHALELTFNRGVVLIHEVVALPVGEVNFVMWDDRDIKAVFTNAKIDVDITVAKTFTRRGGWPLQTISLVSRAPFVDSQTLLKGAIASLPGMLDRWTEELEKNQSTGVLEELKKRLTAFRIVQVANLSVWYRKYLGRISGH